MQKLKKRSITKMKMWLTSKLEYSTNAKQRDIFVILSLASKTRFGNISTYFNVE